MHSCDLCRAKANTAGELLVRLYVYVFCLFELLVYWFVVWTHRRQHVIHHSFPTCPPPAPSLPGMARQPLCRGATTRGQAEEGDGVARYCSPLPLPPSLPPSLSHHTPPWQDMFDPFVNGNRTDYKLIKGGVTGAWKGLPAGNATDTMLYSPYCTHRGETPLQHPIGSLQTGTTRTQATTAPPTPAPHLASVRPAHYDSSRAWASRSSSPATMAAATALHQP
jgi:hypothetical protein